MKKFIDKNLVRSLAVAVTLKGYDVMNTVQAAQLGDNGDSLKQSILKWGGNLLIAGLVIYALIAFGTQKISKLIGTLLFGAILAFIVNNPDGFVNFLKGIASVFTGQ